MKLYNKKKSHLTFRLFLNIILIFMLTTCVYINLRMYTMTLSGKVILKIISSDNDYITGNNSIVR